MDRRKPRTLRDRMARRVAKKKCEVFLPEDFADLGGRRQVQRALRQLVDAGVLVRLGWGLYGRAEVNALTGEPMLAAPGGFIGAAREALDRLGVQWEVSQDEIELREGRSTQISVRPATRILSRFSRRVTYKGRELLIER